MIPCVQDLNADGALGTYVSAQKEIRGTTNNICSMPPIPLAQWLGRCSAKFRDAVSIPDEVAAFK